MRDKRRKIAPLDAVPHPPERKAERGDGDCSKNRVHKNAADRFG